MPNKPLDGYKKVGKKFISPFNHRLGETRNAYYLRNSLPELVWWDTLAVNCSGQFTVDLAAGIANHFKNRDHGRCWWGFSSDYSKLTDIEFDKLKSFLNKKRMLKPLQVGLESFVSLYPLCPQARFLDSPPPKEPDQWLIDDFEARMTILEDKRSRPAILMQAQVIYMGFVQKKLFVKEGLALGDFPEVAKYPNTERSMQVGAAICACLNSLVCNMLPDYSESAWVRYFWGRNLELRPLSLDFVEMT